MRFHSRGSSYGLCKFLGRWLITAVVGTPVFARLKLIGAPDLSYSRYGFLHVGGRMQADFPFWVSGKPMTFYLYRVDNDQRCGSCGLLLGT